MLLLDTTVAPSDITYPTDLDLLNQVREESERLIDVLYEPLPEKVKPRTYRSDARKAYPALLEKFRSVWRNSGSKKKAVVAAARKLAVRLWALETTRQSYCIGVIK